MLATPVADQQRQPEARPLLRLGPIAKRVIRPVLVLPLSREATILRLVADRAAPVAVILVDDLDLERVPQVLLAVVRSLARHVLVP